MHLYGKKYTVDFTNVQYYSEMHGIIGKSLDFPDYYGCNWDAFWDAITGLVDMPEKITITGFDELLLNLPKDAAILKNILEEYNDEYPEHNIELLP